MIFGSEEEGDSFRLLRGLEESVTFLTHFSPTPQVEALAADLTGVEVYNLHENGLLKKGWFTYGLFFYHWLWDPGLFFFQIWELDQDRIIFWDRLLSRHSMTGIAGNDAHQNVGFYLQTATGEQLISFLVDPYVESFRAVSTHVLLQPDQPVNRENILRALREGAAYVAFEKLGDSRGFSFHARSGGISVPMGSKVRSGSELVFQSPAPVRFRVIRSGETFRELEGTAFHFPAEEPGVYRVEAYPLNPPALIQGKPWILSNPIFVE